MKTISTKFFLPLLLTLISSISLFSQEFEEGKIKNENGRTILTIDEAGVVRDINDDIIFRIESTTGSIKDVNNDLIGKYANNQILDWDNNVIITLNSNNKVLDINSEEIGSIDPVTKEIKNISETFLGSYSHVEPIYGVFYFFMYLSY